MTEVRVHDGRSALTFSDPRGPGVAVDYLTVRIEGPGLSAVRQVYAGWEEGFTSLARYFSEMDASWRGWEGERVFESAEGDLRLSASHLGSRVSIRVVLWESTEPLGWRAEAELEIEPGEQLTRMAADLTELLAGRR